MTEQEQIARDEQERRDQEAAAAMLNAKVKELVGAAVGHLEETCSALQIAFNAQAEVVKKAEDRVEQLELALDKLITYMEQPALALTGDQKLRIRIGHTVSVKGIHTYDGTVEGEGLSQEQVMAARMALDADLARLQPTYTEFVEPEVPGLSVGQPVEPEPTEKGGAE